MLKFKFRFFLSMLSLLVTSCSLNGGIKTKMYLCRHYTFSKTSITTKTGEEKNTPEIDNMINKNKDQTFLDFDYDGIFTLSIKYKTEEGKEIIDIQKGNYYQEGLQIFLHFTDRDLVVRDRPNGIPDVTRIVFKYNIQMSEDENQEINFYMVEPIYHPCNK